MGVHQQDNTHLYFIFRSDQIQRRFKLCTKEDGLIVSRAVVRQHQSDLIHINHDTSIPSLVSIGQKKVTGTGF